MQPFSYTGLKAIHDQKIREALEYQHLHVKPETQKQHLLQSLAMFFAHVAWLEKYVRTWSDRKFHERKIGEGVE